MVMRERIGRTTAARILCSSLVVIAIIGVVSVSWIWLSNAAKSGSDAVALDLPELRELVRELAPERPFAARLTGGLPHLPLAARSRGRTVTASPALPFGAVVAAASIERRAKDDPSPAHRTALANAMLLTGRLDDAIRDLQRRRDERADGAAFSDLAAGYLVRHERSLSPLDAVQALDAARMAVRLEARLPEAQFNLALALEAASLPRAARIAWRDYLTIDRSTGWGREVEGRLQAIERSGTPWQDLRRELLAIDRALSHSTSAAAASKFAHATRELVEDDLLTDWALAVASGDTARGVRTLARANEIAGAMVAGGADSLLSAALHSVPGIARVNQRQEFAAAVERYAEGKKLLHETQYARAIEQLGEAARLWARVQSPCWGWAMAQLAYARNQSRDFDGARRDASSVASMAARHGYKALLARARWITALAARNDGKLEEALALSTEAMRLFEDVREDTNAGAVASTAADLARRIGDRTASWKLLADALRVTDREQTPLRRYLTFYNAALFAEREGLTRAALSFQDEAVRAASEIKETGAIAQAYVQRGLLHTAENQRKEATQDLEAARTELATFEGGTKAYMTAEMGMLEAALVLERDPARAERLLRDAASTIEPRSPGRVAELSLALGKASLRQGNVDAAIRQFDRGIEHLEQERTSIANEPLRIALFGTAQELYKERLLLALRGKDAAAAFALSERGRARALLDLSASTASPSAAGTIATLQDIQRALPADTAFIEYTTIRDGLIVWVVTSRTAVRHDVSVDRLDLSRAIQNVHAAPTRAASQDVYDRLIRPLRADLAGVTRLLISPEGPIYAVPFAALRDRSTERWLAEDFAVQMVPSGTWLLAQRSSASSRNRAVPAVLVSVGDPEFDRARNPEFPRLPSSAREAEDVAALYRNARVLTGRAASRRTVLQQLADAEIFHFAGHAVANVERPELSHLLLAPDRDGDDGRLRAADVGALRFHKLRLVVLAGCRTADPTVTFGEGGLHLARSFLAAGAPLVLATLWDVDDETTRDVLLEFHRRLRAGEHAAQALRHAQLAMLSAQPDGQSDHIRRWAPFVLMGSSFDGPARSMDMEKRR